MQISMNDSESISIWLWYIPVFGAGFVACCSRSLRTAERSRRISERALLVSAPNSSMHQTVFWKDIWTMTSLLFWTCSDSHSIRHQSVLPLLGSVSGTIWGLVPGTSWTSRPYWTECRREKRGTSMGQMEHVHEIVPIQRCQEPLNAPFLKKRLFSKGIFTRENGPLRHSGRRPIKVGKRPIKVGERPIKPNGLFRARRHGGKWPLKKSPLRGRNLKMEVCRKEGLALSAGFVCRICAETGQARSLGFHLFPSTQLTLWSFHIGVHLASICWHISTLIFLSLLLWTSFFSLLGIALLFGRSPFFPQGFWGFCREMNLVFCVFPWLDSRKKEKKISIVDQPLCTKSCMGFPALFF